MGKKQTKEHMYKQINQHKCERRHKEIRKQAKEKSKTTEKKFSCACLQFSTGKSFDCCDLKF